MIRCALLLISVVFLSACPMGNDCSPETCGGCCDQNDVCQSPSPLACGAQGAACILCSPGNECRGGFCFQPMISSGGGGGGGGSLGGGGGSAGGGGGGSVVGGGGGSVGGGGGGGSVGGGGGSVGGGGGSVGGGGGGGSSPSDAGTPLTVGCWNLEWFADGDAGLGPPDNALQQMNVVTAFRQRGDVDLWGVEEIVGVPEFENVVSQLTGFDALLATEVQAGTFYYGAAEQKVALLYRTNKVTVLSAKLILTTSSFDFAGRPPLEVFVRVAGTDFYVIVVHMKALADLDGYQRRQAASAALKSYLDTTRATDKVMVIGDFNDDVDVSTYQSSATPYGNFVMDPTKYKFGTKELSDANRRTTAGFSATIDHQLHNAGFFGSYVTGSATVSIPSIPSFSSTTSDHYLVTTRYILR